MSAGSHSVVENNINNQIHIDISFVVVVVGLFILHDFRSVVGSECPLE